MKRTDRAGHGGRVVGRRARRLCAVLTATALLAAWAPGVGVTPTQAKNPTDICQDHFLDDVAPAIGPCATAQPGQPAGAQPDAAQVAAALPTGFTESIIFSGLLNPTNIEFAADGRVFVAEKSGVIKVFDNVSDTTPTTFSGLTTNVHNYWDRGMLGLALDPSLTNPALPLRPWVYVLYTYDHILSDPSHPTGGWNDGCPGSPSGPGATTDGCVVSGRLSRFTVSGTTISGPEQVLIEDWCQQFPSHSIGSIGFGPDGALYVSGGDGASFNGVDYGQLGGTIGTPPFTPKNPCGDPPGGAMTPPTAEGGALRSQDLRTDGSPTGNAYAATVLQDAPVAYWRFGETSGTTAADSAGSNSGTYTGGYTLGQPGALSSDPNTAVLLNGTTGFINVPDANPLDLANGPLTYELWVKRADASTWYQLLYTKYSQGNLFFFNNKFTFDNDNNDIVAESGTTTDTNWHHFVVTRSGTGTGNTKIYKDGVNVTTEIGMSRTLASNASNVSLGRYTASDGLYFKGSLDEVAVYPTALSATRVQAHYAAATGTSSNDPATLDGAILRVDPVSGAAFAGNPFSSSTDPNKRRVIAYGLRNPFRFELRPGTNELWVGDVGWNDWEEINRIANTGDATAENFGWPCYEGNAAMAGYDAANVSICENLYAAGPGAITAPVYTYNHSAHVVSGDICPVGGSAIAGMTFYPESGGNFPTAYRGGLFFADHNRSCIWWMAKGANGQPDPATRTVFLAPAANPVDLEIGPDGALYFADFDGSAIHRVAFSSGNQPPNAVAQANPTSGPAPLTVNFSGTSSTDPENGALTYAWDLDGDGAYDDSTSATPVWSYPTQTTVTVGLKVTDPGGQFDTDSVVVSASNTPPVPVISTPVIGTTWNVGQSISFSGSATDQQDGAIPAAQLTWLLTIMHCPSNCHPHDIQTFPGVASGSFSAPDHEYPSWLELKLTATDSNGLAASAIRRLDPRTVNLTFQTAPSGLQIAVNGVLSTAPFTMPVIEGSSNSITAQSPQVLGGSTYAFQSWSDGGAATHNIVAPVSATYTATFTQTAGNAYAATVLQDAPVAYWRLGETSGTAAADSGGSNTGTYTGGYTLGQPGALSGDPNTAVLLNGTTGFINVPDANPLDLGNGPLTYELWVKRADASTWYQLLYTKYSQGNLFFFNNKFTFDNDNNDIVAESGTTTDTNWHHFVVTRSGTGTGNTKIYKDGVNVTTEIGMSRTLASNASNVSLGRYTASDGLYFKGSLDEVAVYPTALSATRVQAHYAAATGP